MKATVGLLVIATLSLVAATVLFAQEHHPGQSVTAPATPPSSASSYPLDHCIVSGEKLGEMGAPVVKTYDGRDVAFCCKGCVKTFEKDQAKWMKKLDDAIVAAQKPKYPVATCVVSGEKLGTMGEPVDYVYGNRLVRFCCGGCIPTFKKDPAKYLSMLDVAPPSKPATPGATETPHQEHAH